MSPLNRGPLLGRRVPPMGIRPPPPPPPRFGGRLPPPGLPPRMPPPPMNPGFGPMRQRLPPPPRPGGVTRPAGPMPLFGPRARGMTPMVPPIGGIRGTGPRGPLMRPWLGRSIPPQMLNQMRPRFNVGNGNAKAKAMNNVKKVSKLEELELKKPWMTDEIRSEIQKKNKLYAKAKKNKDAKEWEEFKDLRNKVTRMIRDAKNDYLAKHPEQGGQKTDDKNTIESEGVQKTENATEQSEQMELTEETQPSSEQAHHYAEDEEPYDQRDENYTSAEEDVSYYCEVCDREFSSEDCLSEHKSQHKLCGIEGCTFSAHPLLVQKHISMQHSTGLYQRMKNLTTPEDIEKWLIERKKRYPTKANIELRKAEEQEKVRRGEIIKQKEHTVTRKSKKTLNAKNRRRKVQKHKNLVTNVELEKIDIYRGLRAFPGTLSLRSNDSDGEHAAEEVTEPEVNEISNEISDEEDTVQDTPKPTTAQANFSGLVANYGSDSEDDAPDEVPIKKMKMDEIEKQEHEERGSENKTDNSVKLAHRDNVPKKEKYQDNKSVDLHGHSNTGHQRSLTRKQPQRVQLLERLLSRAIQHERNLICQCIKYIVNNNFFD